MEIVQWKGITYIIHCRDVGKYKLLQGLQIYTQGGFRSKSYDKVLTQGK